MTDKVILATPTTLIALLKAAAAGWRVEALTESAREIATLGRNLAQRLETMNNHWSKVGRSLELAVKSYNEALGSYDHRVAPAARRFLEVQSLSKPAGLSVPELIQIQPVNCEETQPKLFDSD